MDKVDFKVKISKVNADRICRAISWFKQNAYQHETKDLITWKVSFDSHLASEILVNYIDVTPEVPESTKRLATNNAIQRFCKYRSYRESKDPLQAFSKALGVELSAAERKIRDYWVVSFLNIDKSSAEKIGEQDILNSTFHLVSWNEVDRFDLQSFWEQTRYQIPETPLRKSVSGKTIYTNKTDFSPVVSKHRTYGAGAAVNFSARRLDLFRAAINLPRVSSFRIRFRSKPEALSYLCPSPVYGVFHEDGSFHTAYFSDSIYKYDRIRISDSEVGVLAEIVDVLNSSSTSSFSEHIVDSMTLYQSALDTSNPQQAFLRFWQTLEVATTPDLRNPKQNVVKSRVTALLDLPPEYSDALQMLMERRNLLVHRGSFPHREDNVLFALKPFADTLIWKLICLSKVFSSVEDYKDYLRHQSLSDKALQSRLKVIESVLEDRHSSKSG